MKQVYRFILLICAVAVQASCIREDISDCETPITLDFIYFADGPTDVFGDYVEELSFYVFPSGSDTPVTVIDITEEELAARAGIDLRLTPGDYRIVSWGNFRDINHAVLDDGQPRVEEIACSMGQTSTGHSDLYFSDLELTVPNTLRPISDTLFFSAAHISITIEMEEFSDMPTIVPGNLSKLSSEAVPDIDIVHEGLSEWIGFDGVPSADTAHYYPPIMPSPGSTTLYYTTYNVPRFDNSTTSELVLKDNSTGGTEMFRRSFAQILDIVGFVIDPDTNEINLRFKLVRITTDVGVQIEVVPWNTEIVYPGNA